MVNHAYFFYFVTWISLIFLMISGVFTDIFGSKKLKTLGGIHETRQKKNWNFSGTPLGPRAFAPASVRRFAPLSGLRSGPRAQRGAREVSIYFFVWFHETTQGFNFCSQKYPWNPWNHQKNQWNQVTKKMRGFLLKPPKFQFYCHHFRETTQNSNNNQWNQVTKKNERFLIKTVI